MIANSIFDAIDSVPPPQWDEVVPEGLYMHDPYDKFGCPFEFDLNQFTKYNMQDHDDIVTVFFTRKKCMTMTVNELNEFFLLKKEREWRINGAGQACNTIDVSNSINETDAELFVTLYPHWRGYTPISPQFTRQEWLNVYNFMLYLGAPMANGGPFLIKNFGIYYDVTRNRFTLRIMSPSCTLPQLVEWKITDNVGAAISEMGEVTKKENTVVVSPLSRTCGTGGPLGLVMIMNRAPLGSMQLSQALKQSSQPPLVVEINEVLNAKECVEESAPYYLLPTIMDIKPLDSL